MPYVKLGETLKHTVTVIVRVDEQFKYEYERTVDEKDTADFVADQVHRALLYVPGSAKWELTREA